MTEATATSSGTAYSRLDLGPERTATCKIAWVSHHGGSLQGKAGWNPGNVALGGLQRFGRLVDNVLKADREGLFSDTSPAAPPADSDHSDNSGSEDIVTKKRQRLHVNGRGMSRIVQAANSATSISHKMRILAIKSAIHVLLSKAHVTSAFGYHLVANQFSKCCWAVSTLFS